MNRGTKGLTAEDSWAPRHQRQEARLPAWLEAWAGRLRLPLSPPPPFALLLLPFSSSCGCCCCQTSPVQTHQAALPSALLRCRGRRAARPPTQVGAGSRGREICSAPARAVLGSVVGKPKNCPDCETGQRRWRWRCGSRIAICQPVPVLGWHLLRQTMHADYQP